MAEALTIDHPFVRSVLERGDAGRLPAWSPLSRPYQALRGSDEDAKREALRRLAELEDEVVEGR